MSNCVRKITELLKEMFDDEGVPTPTSHEQRQTEMSILKTYQTLEERVCFEGIEDIDNVELTRIEHKEFLRKILTRLPAGYECLDASRPWLVYWILHALYLLEALPGADVLARAATFLARCQHENGGFGGGPLQTAHLATTYAAVNAIAIIGTKEAYNIIDRDKLLRFLQSVRNDDGSFAVHVGGEVDTRGVYCALSVACLTNTYSDELFSGTGEWLAACQTYEGGFAACPGMEAHGGYTFCGISSLVLLNKPHLIDMDAALRWCANRQMKMEGGFQGRTNKLVDSCYSFWQGASFPVLHAILKRDNENVPDAGLFDSKALQEYVLVCCQCEHGGMRDKPGKHRDAYHTCYALSGLSVAQHGVSTLEIAGSQSNELDLVHPVHNIGPYFCSNILDHFRNIPVIQNIET